ncbi:MAG TPA: putative toxin-antitoxin system toxin component, PIN family [Solirubrobacterales bacterium]|nr:putative toxin-antitoxin system toxin component, PIN family [Solirubrobacterales bacterium]
MRCARRGVPRAILDPGVLVSALITPTGTAAKLLRAAREGNFDLLVSRLLLDELESVLRRDKFRRYLDLDDVSAGIRLLLDEGQLAEDADGPPPVRCVDPQDDYLIVLAHQEEAALVSGDHHLLDLAGQIPVFSPSEFLATQL